jgi:hypothetical protein
MPAPHIPRQRIYRCNATIRQSPNPTVYGNLPAIASSATTLTIVFKAMWPHYSAFGMEIVPVIVVLILPNCAIARCYIPAKIRIISSGCVNHYPLNINHSPNLKALIFCKVNFL